MVMMPKYKLIKGDALEKLKLLPENSIDACITDPPAGISFMGKEWDQDKGGRDKWIEWLSSIFVEVNRVLKPGGHCLVWSLPRTSHWTGMALEGAGFEVRDCVYHTFGSGFPKSHNIGKGVDKKLGNERIDLGSNPNSRPNCIGNNSPSLSGKITESVLTKGSSIYEGYGTGLKPAVECWWLVRKPISEKTIVDNVLRWGTGGINIDGCRIGFEDTPNPATNPLYRYNNDYKQVTDNGQKEGENVKFTNSLNPPSTLGRFPANFIHDGSDEVMEEFEKAGVSNPKKSRSGVRGGKDMYSNGYNKQSIGYWPEDNGGTPARFFYCSKPSTKERNMGCDELEEKDFCMGAYGTEWCSDKDGEIGLNKKKHFKNNHPTIKSVKLMAYLITLISPPKAIILDPFTGSGTTGISSLLLGHKFIGIELSEDYIKIADTRIKSFEKYRQFLK